MKLLKPVWVNHDDKPIFSVDLHQDCEKFATGGQGLDSGRVVIWNLLPVLSEEAAIDENVPKMLCQMDNHLACVNCVRWSESGQMLASGSDDKLVMIWKKTKGAGGVFGTGGIQKNTETWKCAFTLRGHAGDVLDLAWAPHDRWLASCSVDNTIIVWDVNALPAMLTCLRGHSGLVKGVAWDPVGKYLASQSDDRSVKIWRTSDWCCSKTITEPFEECGGTTHILRLSWSPDGQYLVSAHAMNGGGPTAQIIEREGWKCDKDFVGHRKAVTCVRFHSSILKRQASKTNKAQQYCCLAVGSRDRSVSVWMTALQRPLVVVHELFNDSVLDLSWGPAQCVLIACSGDGTVACLQFTEDEVGTPLPEDEKNSLYQRIYGKSIITTNGTNGSSDIVIENPELLNMSPDKIKPPTLPGISLTNHNNNFIEKTSTQLLTINASTSNFNSNIILSSQSTASATPTIPMPASASPLSPTSAPSLITSTNGLSSIITTPSKATNKQMETRTADGKRRITPMFIPLDQDSTITSNTSASNTRKPIVHENDTQILSTFSSALISNETQGKSAISETAKQHEESEKGSLDQRLVKTKTSTTTIFTTQQINGTVQGPVIPLPNDINICKYTSASRAMKITTGTLWSASTAGPKLNITPTTKCEFQKTALDHRIHVHNGHTQTATGLLAKITAYSFSGTYLKQWEKFIGSPLINLNFNAKYVMLCSLDGTLRLLDLKNGLLILPIISLTSAAIQCAFCPLGKLVGVITDSGLLRLWNLAEQSIHLSTNCSELFKNGPISSFILTEAGLPIIIFSNGQSFSYSNSLQSWIVLNTFDPIMRHGLHTTIPKEMQKDYRLYPLLTAQTSIDNFTALGNVTDLNANNWQASAKIAFAENQVKLCEYMKSPRELKHWYSMLTFYLASHGTEERLRLLFNDLIGKPGEENEEILSVSKHEIFEQALDVLQPHVKWQRLYMEYKELYGYNKFPDRMEVEEAIPKPIPPKSPVLIEAESRTRPPSISTPIPSPTSLPSPKMDKLENVSEDEVVIVETEMNGHSLSMPILIEEPPQVLSNENETQSTLSKSQLKPQSQPPSPSPLPLPLPLPLPSPSPNIENPPVECHKSPEKEDLTNDVIEILSKDKNEEQQEPMDTTPISLD